MKIIGAGLAGLIAGTIFQDAQIIERGPESQTQHKAVLRFRSDAVGRAVGIPFREVTVRKGVWLCGGRFVEPTIQWANLYSRKVLGRLADRSIWNIVPVQRWIAPEDFAARLVARCRGRVAWNSEWLPDAAAAEPTISTIPLSMICQMFPVFEGRAPLQFHFAPIEVRRYRIANADVFQTVYFPELHTAVYRASITGDLLIIESIADYFDYDPSRERSAEEDDKLVFGAFGLSPNLATPVDTTRQRYGKIAPIDETARRRMIALLTQKYGIYSLGRFATWRNILLDDVLADIDVIRRLIGSDLYEHTRAMS